MGRGLDGVGMVWTIWKAAAAEEEEVEVAEVRAVRKWSRRAEGGDEKGERIIKPRGFEFNDLNKVGMVLMGQRLVACLSISQYIAFSLKSRWGIAWPFLGGRDRYCLAHNEPNEKTRR